MLFAYGIPGADPMSVTGDLAVSRLVRAGLTNTQRGFVDGVALLASATGPHKADAFGPAERTAEGWDYYPPKVVQPLQALRGPLADAPGNHEVPLRLGGSLTIRPAYLEPRLVFSGGVPAAHVTIYGRAARALRDSIRNGGAPDLASPEVLAVVFLAVQTTYPATGELLDTVNRTFPFLTDDDLQPILDAVLSAPLALPVAAG